jgi:hypothetical protein
MTAGGLALPPKPRREQEKLRPILEANIPDFPLPMDGDAFIRDLHAAADKREKGQPSWSVIVAVGRELYFDMCKGTRRTQVKIGKRCRCCDETVRQCVLYLRAHGMLGWLHVMGRVGKEFWRRANLYVAPAYIKTEGVRLGRRVATQAASFIVECGRVLGLYPRPTGGLNTTPMKQQPGFT